MRPIVFLSAGTLALTACGPGNLDLDMRDLGRGFDTSAAVQAQTAERPQPDARGVISYPSYQVVVARRGDRVADVAARAGVPADELARYNGVPMEAVLNDGEVLALPRRVPAGAAAGTPGSVDIQTLAGDAINRAGGTGTTAAQPGAVQPGREPVRHQVARGETAYSIARLYGVSVKSLAEWNGLGPDFAVRVGQYLLIPVVVQAAAPASATATTAPGTGSPTPVPPSAATPLPDEETVPPARQATGEAEVAGTPESPDLASQATEASASNARMVTPVSGNIVRDFRKGRNDGIDIAAAAGAPVRAADAGTVAAITRDTDNVPIVVVRHDGGVLTVYANVDDLKVEKGQSVQRGQTIASVRGGDAPFLHFEVREGVEAVDPTDYLQ